MFTGIIEEIGCINNLKAGRNAMQVSIKTKNILKTAKIGDSISINGVCLTITLINDLTFNSDIINETLDKTNLQYIEKNHYVNLERAMKTDSRFDGHIVQGHIEGIGQVYSLKKNKDEFIMTIALPDKLLKYCIYKGSIALNGVSLTIARINKNLIDICLIPHTLTHTTFKNNKVGDYINIETDIIGKYVEKFSNRI